MAERAHEWGFIATEANMAMLRANPYPGRFIGLGVSPSGEHAVQIYAVMGRSENSRNRVLVTEPDMFSEDDLVKTDAFDPRKVEDPSLIIYNAMRSGMVGPQDEDVHVVSNGHQTDNVVNDLSFIYKTTHATAYREIKPYFAKILTSDTFTEDTKTSFEPDRPNFTPRITAFTSITFEPGVQQYGWAITRRDPMTDTPVHTFGCGPLDIIPPGNALAFHTYDGDSDPLPSFSGAPYPIPLEGNSAADTAELFWHHFDEKNRVAMAVKFINRTTGIVEIKIVNELQPEISNDLTKQAILIEAMLDEILPIEDRMPSWVRESIDRDRQMLAMRAGWSNMAIDELERVYKGDSGRKLPYIAV